ncbi:MAG: glycosyltransferase family 4 protein [Phycisphaerae bacterium]|nr:glycosyltransferase family 4 protein [Phycisphaerae bacterium]
MRILLLNQVFYPDSAATAQHGWDLAQHLVAAGHEVTAIASRSLYGNTGASLAKEETVGGVRIVRVGKSLFGKKGFLARAVDFALFYVASLWAVIRLPRHDVIVCFTTPPFIAYAGLLLRAWKGTKCVQWVMDLYPDVAIEFGAMRRGSLAARLLERIGVRMSRKCDASVVLGRCMRDRVIAKGVPAEKVHLINVWSDAEELQPVDRSENRFRRDWEIGNRFLVMYSGNFGIGHDIDTFLRAAERLRGDDRVRFAFVGSGKRKGEVEDFVRARGLPNCILAGVQPRERLAELLSAADAHLVTLLDASAGLMVPSKFYGILAVSRAVLYVGPQCSEVGLTINETGCGTTDCIGDVESLTAHIGTFAAAPGTAAECGRRGRDALVKQFSRSIACDRWAWLLETVHGQRQSGSGSQLRG